jgi:hypothetical protein
VKSRKNGSLCTHSGGGDREENQRQACNGFQPVAVIQHDPAVLLGNKIERLKVVSQGQLFSRVEV